MKPIFLSVASVLPIRFAWKGVSTRFDRSQPNPFRHTGDDQVDHLRNAEIRFCARPTAKRSTPSRVRAS